jgi:sporulation protein YlmC with PRC-barrel domain
LRAQQVNFGRVGKVCRVSCRYRQSTSPGLPCTLPDAGLARWVVAIDEAAIGMPPGGGHEGCPLCLRRTDGVSHPSIHFWSHSMNTSTTTAGNVISSDQVEGTAVYNRAGDKLGSIDDLMIDKRSGQVLYAVLEFGGFLGIGTDRYPMPWSMLKYDTAKEGYVVPIDADKIDKAPRYSEYDVPIYSNEYGKRVHDYYGIDSIPPMR